MVETINTNVSGTMFNSDSRVFAMNFDFDWLFDKFNCYFHIIICQSDISGGTFDFDAVGLV